jgi:hypothetical protein
MKKSILAFYVRRRWAAFTNLLDLQCIDNWSLKLDFVILFKTIRVVLSVRNSEFGDSGIGNRTEVRDRRSEIGGQRSEVRSQRTEVGDRRAERGLRIMSFFAIMQ